MRCIKDTHRNDIRKAEDKTSAFLFSDSFEGRVEFKAQKIENFVKNNAKRLPAHLPLTRHCEEQRDAAVL